MGCDLRGQHHRPAAPRTYKQFGFELCNWGLEPNVNAWKSLYCLITLNASFHLKTEGGTGAGYRFDLKMMVYKYVDVNGYALVIVKIIHYCYMVVRWRSCLFYIELYHERRIT
jgi:hypothetical protein